jgi:hypothetical protein
LSWEWGIVIVFIEGEGNYFRRNGSKSQIEVVIVITDWARYGMTQEDRVIGEPEVEAVLSGKVADKERDPLQRGNP